jgi:hypothetical protein
MFLEQREGAREIIVRAAKQALEGPGLDPRRTGSCLSHTWVSRRDRAADLVCICVEANAKNSFGGYAGLSKTCLLFRAARSSTSTDRSAPRLPDACGSFQPIPEIRAMGSPLIAAPGNVWLVSAQTSKEKGNGFYRAE